MTKHTNAGRHFNTRAGRKKKKNKIKKKKTPINGEDAPGVENEQNEIQNTSESIITLFMPL